MKKLAVFFISVLVLIVFAACNNEGNPSDTRPATGAQSETVGVPVSEETWFFVLEGVRIDLLKALPDNMPEPERIYEIPSCASQGMDKVYDYGSLQITTYNDKGTEIPYNIEFFDENAATFEGISIGKTYDQMVEVYGSDFKKAVWYDYVKGEVTLSFMVNDGMITGVVYSAKIKF
ncbi:MAG: hypothetical protein J5563_03935 [Clostridia bacterium]|nr:hypothetical protein [Clostridia bacterium]